VSELAEIITGSDGGGVAIGMVSFAGIAGVCARCSEVPSVSMLEINEWSGSFIA
jgi:hypothetical protein